jgi:hypothetical protein
MYKNKIYIQGVIGHQGAASVTLIMLGFEEDLKSLVRTKAKRDY